MHLPGFIQKKTTLRLLLTDIRFWILLFFLIRMVGITNPPLEVGHNWRQSLTNMVARNFLTIDANMLYPRIDMAGEKTGIIGTEFPLLNYLIYLVSKIFGYNHWYGRLINLIVSSLGTFAFYRIAKKLFNESTAFNATLIFLASIWFSFSRKIMPDTFSVSLMLIGLLFCANYLENGKWLDLILFFVFSALGMLCKIPSLSLLSVVGVFAFVKYRQNKRIMLVWFSSALAVCIALLWYFYWVPFLIETYRFQLFFPKGIAEGVAEIMQHKVRFFEKFYFSSLYSFIGFAFFITGVYFLFKKERTSFKAGFLIIAAVFVLFAIKTGAVFPLHNYYIIPFTPVVALLAGYALTNVKHQYAVVLLFLICAEGIANQNHDFFIHADQQYKTGLEAITAKYVPPDQLIIINGGPSPQLIYFASRKGWTVDGPMNERLIDSLGYLGAAYVINDNNTSDFLSLKYKLLYTDEAFSVYRIHNR
ncbi:MAG: glycosyltransferase family 39 protein [Bacteroidota bacterium]